MGTPLQGGYRIPDRVLSHRVDDEVVLLDRDANACFGLNAVGARIWELLRDLREPGAIVESIENEYDVSHDRAAADLAELLARLLEAKLLVRTDPAP